MNHLRQFLFRLGGIVRKRKLEAEMSAELQEHLELRTERNIENGMTPEDARYAAMRSFGGVEQIKERARDQHGFSWLDGSSQDLRYGARQLRKDPGFAAVAILTIAIGIGATTAIFSIVNGVMLRPLAYPHPERLVAVHETYPPDGNASVVTRGVFNHWETHATCFSSIAAARSVLGNLTGANDPERVATLQVSPNYFATLGVQPVIGRGFRPEEATPGREKVIVLSHWFWLREFAGRADVLGGTVQLNDESFSIVGVLSDTGELYTGVHVFTPLVTTAADRENRAPTRDSLDVVARLKVGMSLEQAASEMQVMARAMAQQYPDTNKGRGVKLTPLRDEIIASRGGFLMRGTSDLLFLLLGAVSLLMLIACINIANLLLARATSRRKEIAMRAALGASRRRIVHQLLCEGLLLAVLGGSLGVLLAYWSLDVMKPFTANLPRADEISLDSRVLAFSLFITLLTGFSFGLIPALQALPLDLLDGIKDGGKSREGRQSHRFRSTLIVAEVALALALLTGAGLLTRSFVRLQQVELGFEADGVFANPIELPAKKYTSPQQQTAFVDELVARIAHLPDVRSVAFTTGMPVFGSLGGAFQIAGRAEDPKDRMAAVNKAATTAGYFKTLGIPVLHGRAFTERDAAATPRVAIISESLAERFFPNQDPVGQRIAQITGAKEPGIWLEIVGIVRDVKQWGPASDTIRSTPGNVYEPYAQNPTARNLLLVVKADAGANDLPVALRTVIQSLDPQIPLTRMFRLSDGVNESIGRFRISMVIFGFFAGVALLLAAIGIYGVTAYAVTQRTHEIGVRIALGAQRGDILRLVFSHAGKRVGLGLLVGASISLAAGRLLQALLFQVHAQDPITLSAVAVVLTAAAFLACWFPARRATKVDPMVALRCE
jgi:predicted permease